MDENMGFSTCGYALPDLKILYSYFNRNIYIKIAMKKFENIGLLSLGSHVSSGGERNILYKGVEISP